MEQKLLEAFNSPRVLLQQKHKNPSAPVVPDAFNSPRVLLQLQPQPREEGHTEDTFQFS